MSTVQTLQETIADVAERVGPSVVGLGRGWGHGSGVVIAEGQVLTSAHNLRREEVTVSFHDGRRELAELSGRDADLDLAVLAVDTAGAGVPLPRWVPTPATPRPCAGSRPRRRASARLWWRSQTPAVAASGPRSASSPPESGASADRGGAACAARSSTRRRCRAARRAARSWTPTATWWA